MKVYQQLRKNKFALNPYFAIIQHITKKIFFQNMKLFICNMKVSSSNFAPSKTTKNT